MNSYSMQAKFNFFLAKTRWVHSFDTYGMDIEKRKSLCVKILSESIS